MFEENKDLKTEDNQPSASSNEDSNASSPEVRSDAYQDLLGIVTNEEGKPKYASVPEAFKGLVHAQDHIKTLEQELNALKAKAQEEASIQEAIQAASPEEPQESQAPQFNEETFNALFEKRMQEAERAKTSQANQAKVKEALVSKYGASAKDVFYEKAQQAGLSPERAEQLAAESPQLVMSLFGVEQQVAKPIPTSSYNTAGMDFKNDAVPTKVINGEERINLPKGEKSVLVGATTGELVSEMRRHKEATLKKYGIKL